MTAQPIEEITVLSSSADLDFLLLLNFFHASQHHETRDLYPWVTTNQRLGKRRTNSITTGFYTHKSYIGTIHDWTTYDI